MGRVLALVVLALAFAQPLSALAEGLAREIQINDASWVRLAEGASVRLGEESSRHALRLEKDIVVFVGTDGWQPPEGDKQG